MLDMRERSLLLYGDGDYVETERVPLVAGPLTAIYENGDLRYIAYQGQEIVRRIYAVVRDNKWGTPTPVLSDVAVDVQADSFRIAYTAHYASPEKGLEYRAKVTLTGDSDGTITFDYAGEALSAFERNRIGICVLHPAAHSGKPVTVTHTDGTTETTPLPNTINPHQPFFEIAAISEEIASGLTATLQFSGDVFEMEDQRNWSDASFKTYSTPLALPVPVKVEPGDTVHQSVVVRIQGAEPNTQHQIPNTPTPDPRLLTPPLPVVVRIAEENRAMFPGFGFLLSSERLPLADEPEMALHSIRFSHLRIDVDVTETGWQEKVAMAGQIAASHEVPFLLGLKNFEKMPISTPGMTLQIPPGAFLFLSHSGEFIPDYGKSRPFLPPGAMLVAGSSNNFTELNRNRPNAETVDGVVYAASPQVHAFDNTSIMETPPMYAESLRTAKSFLGDKPVFLGPLTLYRPGKRDAKQQTGIFGAAWYVAALIYAAQGGADAITLCELSGPHGLLSDAGEPYPLFFALTAFGTATGQAIQTVTVSDPLAVACGAFRTPDGAWQDIFLVNLQPKEVSVTIEGIGGTAGRVRVLEETTGGQWSGVSPVTIENGVYSLNLMPYSIVQLISGSEVY